MSNCSTSLLSIDEPPAIWFSSPPKPAQRSTQSPSSSNFSSNPSEYQKRSNQKSWLQVITVPIHYCYLMLIACLNRLLVKFTVHSFGGFCLAKNLRAQKGDLIEFQRFLFRHWAVYVGNDEIIHLITELNPGIISRTNLIKYAEDTPCRVNNLDEIARDKYAMQPLKMNAIMENAFNDLDKKIFYNVFYDNCEHRATSWRFGRAFSEQVSNETCTHFLLTTCLIIGWTIFNNIELYIIFDEMLSNTLFLKRKLTDQ